MWTTPKKRRNTWMEHILRQEDDTGRKKTGIEEVCFGSGKMDMSFRPAAWIVGLRRKKCSKPGLFSITGKRLIGSRREFL